MADTALDMSLVDVQPAKAAKPKRDPVPAKTKKQQPTSKPNKQPKQQPTTQPKKQKGPKGNKPAPKAFEFYYQQLASDLAQAASGSSMRGLSDATRRASRLETHDVVKNCTVTATETTTTTTTTTTVTKKNFTIQLIPRPSRPASLHTTTSDSAASESTLAPLPHVPSTLKGVRVPKSKTHQVVTLDDISAVEALEHLLERYGGVQHGGILDKNYSFFVTRAHDAAISFIVKDKIAVVGGDPLCPVDMFDSVFAEFKEYRKKNGLGWAIFGGSDALLDYAKSHKWSSMRFGTERVLNPMDNPVLQEKAQKQVIRQNKMLLDPKRGGHTLGIYSPSAGRDEKLQAQLVGVYEAWREARNTSGVPQAYTTIYDPFALPSLMLYIYTRDADGIPNGFAALRKIGSRNGYYIDPCVAAPGAHRRITDLLYFTAMALLNHLGCGHLSIGMEPSAELDLVGFPTTIARWTQKIHTRLFDGLKLAGKKEYHDKFRPDEKLESGLHLMFPGGLPRPRQLIAVLHFANVSVRRLVKSRLDYKGTKETPDAAKEGDKAEEKESSSDS